MPPVLQFALWHIAGIVVGLALILFASFIYRIFFDRSQRR